MTEALDRWVRRIENEEPPDLGPRIRARQPAGEGVPRGPRGSRAVTVVGIALVTIILAAGIIVPLKALWPLAGDREGPTTPAAAAPLAVLSPAPRECPVGFGESGRRIQAEEVPALMRGHLPVWLPPGFGLAAAWEETMVSPWATWSDPTCRSVTVSFSPGGEGPSSWRTLYDKPNACGNSIMGSGRCIGFNVQASDGTVSVQTIGLSTAEAEQVMWSIPLGTELPSPSAAGQPPSRQMYLGLWPERTLAEAQQVQEAVDAGDQTEVWRTHPEEVAKHFVTAVMRWREDMGDAPGLFVQSLSNDSPCCTFRVTRTLHSWPPPGPPWWETASEEITVRQLVSPGAEGIWSVTGVRADQLTVPYEPGAEIGTDLPLQGRVDSREDHLQLGGEGGSACSQGEVATISGPDAAIPDFQPWTSQITFFRSPECGKAGDGYVALVVGDPPVDPLGPVDPGLQKRYIPALTVVPVRFIPSPSGAPTGGSQLSACPFGVGDSISRGGIGARVPEPGGSVSGYGDKADGGSSSIQIDTSTDGVVTITSSKNGVDSPPESCQLSTVPTADGEPVA